MDPVEILSTRFKLSRYEARAYVAVLHGSSDPKEISSRAGVPMPRIYDIMRSLESKGFIIQSDSGFQAFEPEVALDGRIAHFEEEFLKESQQMRISKDELLSRLKIKRRSGDERHEVIQVSGLTAIANSFLDIMSRSKTVYLVVKKSLRVKDLFKSYLKEMKGRHQLKMILTSSAELADEDKQMIERLGIRAKQFDHAVFDMMVSDAGDVLIGVPDPVSGDPLHAVALWVKNPAFARTALQALDTLWPSLKDLES
jgi:sugar-specific transcriptional regulator TrmB